MFCPGNEASRARKRAFNEPIELEQRIKNTLATMIYMILMSRAREILLPFCLFGDGAGRTTASNGWLWKLGAFGAQLYRMPPPMS